MNAKQTIAAAGMALLLGGAGMAGTGFAQSQEHGGHGTPTREVGGSERTGSHGAMMEEMHQGEAAGGDATEAPAGGQGHPAQGAAAPTGSPATEAYRAANLAMHEAMDIEFSGDADIDFARGMIGHHQGAIDMARTVLEHGKDPELRRLAEEVIEAQEAEIAFLRDWLAQRGE